MIISTGLRNLARSVIIQALLDYAKAAKTLKNAQISAAKRGFAENDLRKIEEMFRGGGSEPWILWSEWSPEWLLRRFEDFSEDVDLLERVAGSRFFQTEYEPQSSTRNYNPSDC